MARGTADTEDVRAMAGAADAGDGAAGVAEASSATASGAAANVSDADGEVAQVAGGAGAGAGAADGADAGTSDDANASDAAHSGGASFAPGSFLNQLSKYFGVSFTQTFVEFGVFAALEGIGLSAHIANVFALTCSCSYNFLMNRNITFKASSNFARSVVLFIMLYCWNMLFSSTCLAVLPGLIGLNSTIVKLMTMACQGCWGFLLCRYVIFK